MGGCMSAAALKEREQAEREKRLNKLINIAQDQDKDQEEEVLKLLLLGTGESGKSTLFKQIIQLYGKGFNADARLPYVSIVYTNVLVSIKQLITQSTRLDEKLEVRCARALEPLCQQLLEIPDDRRVDEQIAQLVKAVWADPGIKRTYVNRARFQLSDACKWFFERVDEIAKSDYLPSYQDVLRVRARTTGIVETAFELEGNKFKMLDVGGQRNERKKWFHCFEDVTAVIFVTAINEYDQVLYEDGQTNRIHESLELFGEICNSRWFRKTAMILFLNKSDLFKEKIELVDLNCCFEGYDGGCHYDNAANFIKEAFLAKNDYPQKKKIYVHITCATNTENIEFTFNVVKDIIVKNGLKECGLLV